MPALAGIATTVLLGMKKIRTRLTGFVKKSESYDLPDRLVPDRLVRDHLVEPGQIPIGVSHARPKHRIGRPDWHCSDVDGVGFEPAHFIDVSVGKTHRAGVEMPRRRK